MCTARDDQDLTEASQAGLRQLDPPDFSQRPLSEPIVHLGERQMPEQFPGPLEHLHFAAGRRALGQLGGEGAGGPLGQLTIDEGNQVRTFVGAESELFGTPGHDCKSSSMIHLGSSAAHARPRRSAGS